MIDSKARHVCNDCGTTFGRRDGLLRHQRASNGTCRDKARSARQIKHAAAAGLMGLGIAAPAPGAEPRFLIIPLPPNVDALFDVYSKHAWVQHPLFHAATFHSGVKSLIGTKQERSDYLALDLCPVLTQAVIWTGAKLQADDAAAELWGSVCWANVVAWASRLGLDVFSKDESVPGTGLQDPPPSPNDYYRFLRVGVVLVHVLLMLGRAVAAVRLREWYTRAHRLAGFGIDPLDGCVPDGEGGWTAARDPEDLASFIYAEERSRTNMQVIFYDALLAELQGVKPTTFCTGYLLRSGEIRCSDRGGDPEAETVETFEEGTYGNVAMPCPDSLWEMLPVASEIGDGWHRHPAFALAEQWKPVPLSETWAWMDLSYDSEERNAKVELLFGDCLRRGFIYWLGCVMPTLTMLVRYRDHCLVRGFKLNDPPQEQGPDADIARKLRDSLVLQFRDIWERLPGDLVTCDDAADARTLLEIGATSWSPRLGIHTVHTLLDMHGWLLTLNSPRDVFQDLREIASHAANRTDGSHVLDRLLAWSTTQDFIVASSHAIAISKLARSILDLEGKPDSTGKPMNIVRSFTSLLPFFVIRAAWIHVICILNLKRATGQVILTELPGTPGESLTLGFLETLLEDVGACLRSIDVLASGPIQSTGPTRKRPRLGSDPWRYASTAHSVVRKLLSVDFSTGHGFDLTEEEVEMLSLLKDVGN